ncbi:TIGR00341 family protein [Oceanobacillus luteolus]|uniref:TIGR00341 family protein n=1 Tax=Oceanobacillus luteolus TaxID=1274358 RepID=A0ABW4HMY6_9BACI
MSLQLLEIYAPKNFVNIEEIKENFSVISYWNFEEEKEKHLTRILLETNDVEPMLDYLESLPASEDDYQVMLLSVQTYLPRKKEKEEDKKKKLQRASRHELYTTVQGASRISVSYIWFIIFSAIVAAVGIIKSSPAIVIGAMLIAPLIGPVTAISFASVLGDYKLIRQSIITSLVGIGIPLVIAAIFSFFFDPPIYSDEFLSRTDIHIIDFIAAIVSGAAGALSFVKRNTGALVGVMVSVALIPPTVVFGMILGTGNWTKALVPFILLMVNVCSILLSAVIVFWLSGIKPNNWQDIQRANISRKLSLIFILTITVILVTAILFINVV